MLHVLLAGLAALNGAAGGTSPTLSPLELEVQGGTKAVLQLRVINPYEKFLTVFIDIYDNQGRKLEDAFSSADQLNLVPRGEKRLVVAIPVAPGARRSFRVCVTPKATSPLRPNRLVPVCGQYYAVQVDIPLP